MTTSKSRKQIVFHGGDIEETSKVWPLIHVGTRAAAIDRIFQNIEDSHEDKPMRQSIYRCILHPAKHMITLPDWHTPHASGVILALTKADLLSYDERARFNLMFELNALERNDPLAARERVLAEMRSLDIDLIAYPNRHEGQAGNPSYCVVNPSLIEVIDDEKIDVPAVRSKRLRKARLL